ncbi:MAG: hypothetical protein J6I68_00530 [Butyrivibrio sp.]|uniref:hypothetical protein n=1 Tax=Butyrivibrio sp. TaxID=28121 RepID=UPI001B429CF8|nr:hypothetical protein [Butyrivibrio sp.]MBP3781713.1 hypothetical protein [Butyrivibrio sp.]
MDFNYLKKMTPYEFLNWLNQTFPVHIPQKIVTIEDMDAASKELLSLISEYSYITELASWFKVATRDAKRTETKNDYEDMVDKKEAVEKKMEALKQTYAGISRAITIRTENNAELRMTSSRHIA